MCVCVFESAGDGGGGGSDQLPQVLFCFSAFYRGAVIGRQLLHQMLGRKAKADGKQLCEEDKGRKKYNGNIRDEKVNSTDPEVTSWKIQRDSEEWVGVGGGGRTR